MAYFQKVKAKNKQGYRWKCTKEAPRHPLTGKRRQVTRRADTKKEAESRVNEALEDLIETDNGNTDSDLIDITVEELFEKWFEIVMKRKVKESTFREYTNAAKNRVIPVLGMYKVTNVNSIVLQKYVNGLIDEGLSERYIEYLLAIIYGAFDTARKWRIITENPLTDVERPRPRRKKYVTWSVEEINKILSVSKINDYQIHTILSVAIFTGMRRGEILGLMWEDIDFENKTINVKRNLMLGSKGYVLTTPKTQSSVRSISFGDALEKTLKKWKAKQNEMIMAVKNVYNDNGLVFTNSFGDNMSPRYLTEKFYTLMKLSEVTKIRFHDIRHTHATVSLEAGTDLKELQDRLGHASIKTTGDVYAHVTDKMRGRSVDLFESYVKKTN